MSNTAALTLTRVEKSSFPFKLYDRDHLELSTASVLSSSASTIAMIAIDAQNPRMAWISGMAPGTANITVQESPATTNPLVITVTVQDTPNLSEVTLDGPFSPPVSRL